MTKLISLVISAYLFTTLMPISAAFAAVLQFPLCTEPQGTLIAKYDNGTHGIVGRTGAFEGSDAVYLINDNQVMQCYCPLVGNGIQTNWLKANPFSESEQKIMQSEGWIFVPDGSAWGLTGTSYLAKNTEFACSTITSVNNTSEGKSDGKGSQGSVLGAAASSISSLASTGNITALYGAFGFGVISLFTGYFLSKRNNKEEEEDEFCF